VTNSQLPHNTLAVCSLPTLLAGCGAAAVIVYPSSPPSITCVEPCAPVPAASYELPLGERPASHDDDDALEFDHILVETPLVLVMSSPRGRLTTKS
jgi:hypothetical protein